MVIRPNVKITEKGKKETGELKKRLKELQGYYVTIGVHDDHYEDGTSVIDVALWNEFGTESIPARSFFRSTLDGSERLINDWREKALDRIFEGRSTPERELTMIGFRIRELIRTKIQSNIPPPNAPETAAKKKAEGVAARTLVETGLLLRSIEFKVTGGVGK